MNKAYFKRCFAFVNLLILAFTASPLLANDLFNQPDSILIPTDYVERQMSKAVLDNKLNRLVSETSKDKAKYVSFFKGPGSLIGVILKGNSSTGKKGIAWHPAGTELIIFGRVINTEGRDQTSIAEKAFLKKEDPGFDSSSLSSFQYKKGIGDQIYIVINPDCDTCAIMMRKLADPTTRFKENVGVHIVPVPNSNEHVYVRKAASLLKYGDLNKALLALARKEPIPTQLFTAVKNNHAYLNSQFNEYRTPMLLHNGKVIKTFQQFIATPNPDSLHPVQ
tara:strand:+ start:167 stop:1000 length:834 start_codon:yes stop_codon:yes gene_type:complete